MGKSEEGCPSGCEASLAKMLDLDTGRQADVWKGQEQKDTHSLTHRRRTPLPKGRLCPLHQRGLTPTVHRGRTRPGSSFLCQAPTIPGSDRAPCPLHAHPAPSAPGPSLTGHGQSLSAQLSWALRNFSLHPPPSPQIFQEIKSPTSNRQKLLATFSVELLVL